MRTHRLVRRSQDIRRNSRRLRLELLEPRMCLALDVPALSSLPGASKTIYLDFDGHVTQGTSWNSYFNQTTINSPAYNIDADPANFSATELTQIENAWMRTAEDFYPFQVNVTTVDPGIESLRNTGGGDTQWGIRAVVTTDNVGCGCGGIAYIDSFNWNSDTPVFIYNTGDKNVAEAASHEIGHSLGLSHDGTSTSGYYSGHGSGETGWAPIMGVGYSKNVTQFDKGEYYGSNNAGTGANYSKGPDDLGIITSYNGFGYRTDDAGDTAATAASLTVSGTSVSTSGVIGRTTDVDYFGFVTGAGSVTLNAAPFTPGPNLDIKLDLFDANGTLVASANPDTVLTAGITATLAAGQYYLRVDGTGVGNPTISPPTGYTEYASLGRYTITGTIVAAVNDALSIATTDAVKPEGNSGTTTPFTFTVTRSGATTGTTTVNYVVTGSVAPSADATDFGGTFPGDMLTFGPTVTSQTITINVIGDMTNESNEGFTVTLSGASGTTQISNAAATGTIQNDDAPPPAPTLSIAATSANKPEGTGASPTGFTFTITRSGDTSGTSSVKYSVSGVGGGTTAAKASDFDGGVFPTNVPVNFAAGQTSAFATILVAADSVKEKNEKFRVTLVAATGATISTATADGIIQNDDGTATGASHSPFDVDDGYINVLLPHAFPLPGASEELDHVHTSDHMHDDELDMPDVQPVDSSRLIPLGAGVLFGGSPISAIFVLETNRLTQVSPLRTFLTTSTTSERTRDAAVSAAKPMMSSGSGDRGTSRSSTVLRHGVRTATRDASALQADLVDDWMTRFEPLDL